LKPDLFPAYLNLARLYEQSKAYDKALQEHQKVLLKDPNFLPSYMLTGILYERQQQYEKAMTAYKQALERNPKFAPAANNLAWLYAEHGGNIDVALSLAQTAREELHDEPHIADTLGWIYYNWIYYKKNVYLKAIGLLKESVAKLLNDPVVHYHLGMAYFKNGEKELARKTLELSLTLSLGYAGAEEARKTLGML
jgi:tetratricopeptide (TPR) repeat protein